MEMSQEQLSAIFENYNSQCYICSKCGKIIFPIVSINNDEVNFSTEIGEVRSGIGNKIVKDNICKDCIDKTLKFASDMTKIKMSKFDYIVDNGINTKGVNKQICKDTNEISKRIDDTINNWETYKKEAYNTYFAISKQSSKLDI